MKYSTIKKNCQAKNDKKREKINIRQIAQKLTAGRKAKKKTQKELAEKLGITRAAYCAYERGHNLPPIDKLVVIARELELSLDYIAAGSDDE